MLPHGWQEVFDDDGQLYFYNETTGQSQWEWPSGDGEANVSKPALNSCYARSANRLVIRILSPGGRQGLLASLSAGGGSGERPNGRYDPAPTYPASLLAFGRRPTAPKEARAGEQYSRKEWQSIAGFV